MYKIHFERPGSASENKEEGGESFRSRSYLQHNTCFTPTMYKTLAAGTAGFLLGAAFASRMSKTSTEQVKKLPASNKETFVGIDLGGTTVGVAVVDGTGKKLANASRDIASSSSSISNHDGGQDLSDPRSFNNVVTLICTLVREALAASKQLRLDDITAFGIGAPGLLDTDNGIIQAIANFEWKDVHITKEVAQNLGVTSDIVYLENDANSALLAELWTGAGQGKTNVVMVTLGTGVGCAIMADGHLLRGNSGDAGELGHTILVPNGRSHGTTGVNGIFEGYASATAVVGRIQEELQSSTAPSPLRSSSEVLTCERVFRHGGLLSDGTTTSDERCNIAQRIVNETMEYIGIGCINVCRCYDPEVVILTGGMTRAGTLMLEAIRKAYTKHHWNITEANKHRVVFAHGGDDAGSVGAAGAAFLRQHGSFT